MTYSPSDNYVKTLIHIESGGNPRARTGSNWGLGQFGPAERAKYGLNDDNWTDQNAQLSAIKASGADNAETFKSKFGRYPTDGELYLMHQQGAAGAPALLSNPDQPAWKAIRPYYASDAIAQRAVSGNIPTGNPLKSRDVNDVTAGDFSNIWTSRFGAGAPAPAPAATPAGPSNVAVNGAINSVNPTTAPDNSSITPAPAVATAAPQAAPAADQGNPILAMLGKLGTDDKGNSTAPQIDLSTPAPLQLRAPNNQAALLQALAARLGNRGLV